MYPSEAFLVLQGGHRWHIPNQVDDRTMTLVGCLCMSTCRSLCYRNESTHHFWVPYLDCRVSFPISQFMTQSWKVNPYSYYPRGSPGVAPGAHLHNPLARFSLFIIKIFISIFFFFFFLHFLMASRPEHIMAILYFSRFHQIVHNSRYCFIEVFQNL